MSSGNSLSIRPFCSESLRFKVLESGTIAWNYDPTSGTAGLSVGERAAQVFPQT